MAQINLERVADLIGRDLTEAELRRAPALADQALALIRAYTRRSWDEGQEPDLVALVAEQMVANAIRESADQARSGGSTADQSSFTAGPFGFSQTRTNNGGGVWMTAQLKTMLNPLRTSVVAVQRTSERYS